MTRLRCLLLGSVLALSEYGPGGRPAGERRGACRVRPGLLRLRGRLLLRPGSTDTCLRVGGRVRAELSSIEPVSHNDNAVRFRARPSQHRLRARRRRWPPCAYIRYEITQDTSGTGSSDGIQTPVVNQTSRRPSCGSA